MTEDIGSGKHKRPSSAEIEVAERIAVMRERLAQAKARDETIMAQLDIIVSKVSKVETNMLLGDRRFHDLEKVQGDTTEALKAVTMRTDAIEKKQDGVANKMIGGAAVVGFLVGSWHVISAAASKLFGPGGSGQ